MNDQFELGELSNIPGNFIGGNWFCTSINYEGK